MGEHPELPGWYTRTDPTFGLDADPRIFAVGPPSVVHRNVAAYEDALLSRTGLWRTSEVDSAYFDPHSRRPPRSLDTGPLSINGRRSWQGSTLETVPCEDGKQLIAHNTGAACDELRFTTINRKRVGEGTTTTFKLGAGHISQIAPLCPPARPGVWEAFVRSGPCVTLVRTRAVSHDDIVIEPVEKLVFKKHVAHVSGSHHSRSMAAVLDEDGNLFQWHAERGATRHGSCSVLPADFKAPSEGRLSDPELSCDYSAHPMCLYVIAGNILSCIDLRIPLSTSPQPCFSPLPYFREGMNFIAPLPRAVLQSRSCPYSTYVSTDLHMLLMDRRHTRDPVLRWEQGSVGRCSQLRPWPAGVPNVEGEGVISWGLRSRMVCLHVAATYQPSSWMGWQMVTATSSKVQCDGTHQRPLTFTFQPPDLSKGEELAGAMFVDSNTIHTNINTSMDEEENMQEKPDQHILVLATSLGDILERKVAITSAKMIKDATAEEKNDSVEGKPTRRIDLKLEKALEDVTRQPYMRSGAGCLVADSDENTLEGEIPSTSISRSGEFPPSMLAMVKPTDGQKLLMCRCIPYEGITRSTLPSLLEGNENNTNSQPGAAVEVEVREHIDVALVRHRRRILEFLAQPRSMSDLKAWVQAQPSLKPYGDAAAVAISDWPELFKAPIRAPVPGSCGGGIGAVVVAPRTILNSPPGDASMTSVMTSASVTVCSTAEFGSKVEVPRADDLERTFPDISGADIKDLMQKWGTFDIDDAS